MAEQPSPGDPQRRSNVTVLIVISAVLLGTWAMMWSSGLFARLGRWLSVVVLATDAVILGLLWTVLLRRGTYRRK